METGTACCASCARGAACESGCPAGHDPGAERASDTDPSAGVGLRGEDGQDTWVNHETDVFTLPPEAPAAAEAPPVRRLEARSSETALQERREPSRVAIPVGRYGSTLGSVLDFGSAEAAQAFAAEHGGLVGEKGGRFYWSDTADYFTFAGITPLPADGTVFAGGTRAQPTGGS